MFTSVYAEDSVASCSAIYNYSVQAIAVPVIGVVKKKFKTWTVQL